MAERFALPYLWASGYGMSFLVKSGAAGRFWRQAITLLRRRADAQILPDKLFAAKPRKTQFTAVLILR